jgi:hypothetical protein
VPSFCVAKEKTNDGKQLVRKDQFPVAWILPHDKRKIGALRHVLGRSKRGLKKSRPLAGVTELCDSRSIPADRNGRAFQKKVDFDFYVNKRGSHSYFNR